MKIDVENTAKDRMIRYNLYYHRYGLFGTEKTKLNSPEERISFFDQKWNYELRPLLENAISQGRLLDFNVVKHRLEEANWQQAATAVKPNQVHYEFKYENLLCIAQLKTQNSIESQLTEFWALRYSKVPDEVICINLGTVEKRKLLDKIAEKCGERTQEFAKRAIFDKLNSVISNLEKQNQSLRLEIEELTERRRQVNIDFYREVITDFKERLTKDYPETKGNESWQSWIYKNNWLFGIQYGQPIEKQRVGLESIPDFLFPTIDGFIDILEIKRPIHQVISEDSSHSGSFTWSSEANKAIGQVVNYLHEIELNQLQLYKRLNHKYCMDLTAQVSLIKPRAFILIGRSNDWSEVKREALRKLNHALHGIEVLTYDNLILRGQSLIDLYVREIR